MWNIYFQSENYIKRFIEVLLSSQSLSLFFYPTLLIVLSFITSIPLSGLSLPPLVADDLKLISVYPYSVYFYSCLFAGVLCFFLMALFGLLTFCLYSWPLNNSRVKGTDPLCSQKPNIIYSQSCMFIVADHPTVDGLVL